jgi:hypothetical protein
MHASPLRPPTRNSGYDAELILRSLTVSAVDRRIKTVEYRKRATPDHSRASSASYSAWVPMKNHTIDSPWRWPTAR